MRRRGFTIIETIVVIAIAIAVSSIVVPAIASRATAGRLGHAERMLQAAAVLAQSEAMRAGDLRLFVAERDRDEWVLYAEPINPAEVAAAFDTAMGPSEPRDPSAAGRRVELGSFTDVAFTWDLPPVSQEDVMPGFPDGTRDLMDLPEPSVEEGWDAPRPDDRVAICVFFPDGSCRAAPTLFLIGEAGRRRSIRIEPLTGRIDVRGLPTVEQEAEQLGSGDPDPIAMPPEPADRRAGD